MFHLPLAQVFIVLSSFLLCIDALRRANVLQIVQSFALEVLDLHVCLEVHLIDELSTHEPLLGIGAIRLGVKLLVGLLRTKVRLEVLTLHFLLQVLSVTIILDLLCQVAQVLQVVLAFELLLVRGDQVLFVLLPTELFSLEFTCFLDLLALFLEASMRLLIRLVQVLHKLLALTSGMVINLEGSLRAHEIRISLRVVARRNLLPVQRESNDSSHIIVIRALAALRRLRHEKLNSRDLRRLQLRARRLLQIVQMTRGLIEPAHVLVTLRRSGVLLTVTVFDDCRALTVTTAKA